MPVISRLLVLRVAYIAATVAVIAMGVYFLFGGMWAALGVAPADLSEDVRAAMLGPLLGAMGILIALTVVCVVLAVRPWWWGKLVLPLPGVIWIAISLGRLAMRNTTDNPALLAGGPIVQWAPLAFGLVLVVVAILHQIIDPRFGGRPLGSPGRGSED